MMAQMPKPKPDLARNFSAMVQKMGTPVAAAWPSGMSQLTQAYEACRRCDADAVCADWLERAPNSIQLPPEFCPNAAEFTRMNRTKSRG